MATPNCSGSFANRKTSSAFSKKRANSFSNPLSHRTRLKTLLLAAIVGRDQGNGAVSDTLRPVVGKPGVLSRVPERTVRFAFPDPTFVPLPGSISAFSAGARWLFLTPRPASARALHAHT